MPVRMTVPSPLIDSIRGCVAIERGPVVYCMEDADLPAGVRLADVSLRTGVPARLLPGPEILPEGRAIGVTVSLRAPTAADPWPWPYRALEDQGSPAGPEPESREVTMLPYYAWANRGDGAMRVWIPEARE